MDDQITIAGQTFQVPLRYSEGHELTAGEASALNQTYHENIRNNMAKRVKEASEAGTDLPTLQGEVTKYASEYQFGLRTGGGTSRDPVEAEAIRIAKSKITAALKQAGKKVGDVDASALTEAAKALVGRDASIMELARQRVQQTQQLAVGDLADIIGSIPEKVDEPPAAPPAPSTDGRADAPTAG